MFQGTQMTRVDCISSLPSPRHVTVMLGVYCLLYTLTCMIVINSY